MSWARTLDMWAGAVAAGTRTALLHNPCSLDTGTAAGIDIKLHRGVRPEGIGMLAWPGRRPSPLSSGRHPGERRAFGDGPQS